ncbi:MAG: Fe-S cluster domain-containing protein [Bacteroidota bacterium]|nr:Fe-S cluster domain-containing protein [Bacteroidota bacterium]
MILYSIISLGVIGVISAIILFFVAKKFNVVEDPRIDEVEEVLPAANCGGCGYPGCRNFAEEIVKAESVSGFYCPVGGNDVMAEVGKVMGLEVTAQKPLIAVIRCNGTKKNSPQKSIYDGIESCAVAHNLFAGEGGCSYGCLGLGDCVDACDFDAIHMDPETGLPVVNDKCTACGACVEACPRDIIELRHIGPKAKRIFVSCVNKEKGAKAVKNCKVACIGCGKCEKVCDFDAITIENNLAYIDYEKCKLCRKCVTVCPTNAIWEINFPLKKVKVDKVKRVEAKVEKEKKSENKTDN